MWPQLFRKMILSVPALYRQATPTPRHAEVLSKHALGGPNRDWHCRLDLIIRDFLSPLRETSTHVNHFPVSDTRLSAMCVQAEFSAPFPGLYAFIMKCSPAMSVPPSIFARG